MIVACDLPVYLASVDRRHQKQTPTTSGKKYAGNRTWLSMLSKLATRNRHSGGDGECALSARDAAEGENANVANVYLNTLLSRLSRLLVPTVDQRGHSSYQSPTRHALYSDTVLLRGARSHG
jgi:hypothetical protein